MKRSYFSLAASIVIVLGGALLSKDSLAGYSTIQEVGIITGMEKLDLSRDLIVRVPANSKKGFNFHYYLFIPSSIKRNRPICILVEPNNTGKGHDELRVHDEDAKKLARSSHANKIARKLNVPLLIPVFPRPIGLYTHSLGRKTILVKKGPLKRIDLQLVAMIKNAQELLKRNNIEVKSKVLMHGFSASGHFVTRFAILHPGMVRATAAGGVSGIPTFPTSQWQNSAIRYPLGIADLKEIAGINFDKETYKRISQYFYMGYLDRNDPIPFRDAHGEKSEIELVKKLVGAETMPDRWNISQTIYKQLRIPAQFVTYNDTGHAIKKEMVDDITRFFAANSGDSIVEIEPHQYPFVEHREIREARINGLFWKGDIRIPEWARDLLPKPLGTGSFAISIEEPKEARGDRQLATFFENAGFNFVLKREGCEDVTISEENIHGTASGGGFRCFVVRLFPTQIEKLVPGEYTIKPINENMDYIWKVNEDVRLMIQKDIIPPTVTAIIPNLSKPVPVDTREIRIVFSERMAPGYSVDIGNLRKWVRPAEKSTYSPKTRIYWDDERENLTITVDALIPSTTYTIILNPEGRGKSLRDLWANPLETCTLSFTTEE